MKFSLIYFPRIGKRREQSGNWIHAKKNPDIRYDEFLWWTEYLIYEEMLKISFTVNQLLFASEKISREPHRRECFSSRTGCFMKFCMYEEGLFTNITCR
jgi:hypothetical protein